jgi:hypothetical protein
MRRTSRGSVICKQGYESVIFNKVVFIQVSSYEPTDDWLLRSSWFPGGQDFLPFLLVSSLGAMTEWGSHVTPKCSAPAPSASPTAI